jgi:ribosomal protein S27AE
MLMASPTCGKCGGTTFSGSTRSYNGVKLVLVYCATCGNVVGAASKQSN